LLNYFNYCSGALFERWVRQAIEIRDAPFFAGFLIVFYLFFKR